MEKKPLGRAHSSLPRELGVQRGDRVLKRVALGTKSLEVPSRRAAQLSQPASTGLPEEVLTMQHALRLRSPGSF